MAMAKMESGVDAHHGAAGHGHAEPHKVCLWVVLIMQLVASITLLKFHVLFNTLYYIIMYKI